MTNIKKAQAKKQPQLKLTSPIADYIKEQGNVAFKAKQYNDAIDLYTKAISVPPLSQQLLSRDR